MGTASFGPEPEMQVSGRVAVWEPPRRVVFDGGEGVDGLTFEWTVEPRGDDACVVRLVNSGFGGGPEQDALREATSEGWRMYMFNLRLHLEHFAGRTASAVIPVAQWTGPREAAWQALRDGLGIPADPVVGDRIEVTAADTPELAGTVVDVDPRWVALLLDRPAPGTAFLVVEGDGEHVAVSIWSYLYGPDAAAAAARRRPPLAPMAHRPRQDGGLLSRMRPGRAACQPRSSPRMSFIIRTRWSLSVGDCSNSGTRCV